MYLVVDGEFGFDDGHAAQFVTQLESRQDRILAGQGDKRGRS